MRIERNGMDRIKWDRFKISIIRILYRNNFAVKDKIEGDTAYVDAVGGESGKIEELIRGKAERHGFKCC